MILALLQFAAVAIVLTFLARWRASLRRRNLQAWDSLVTRLRSDRSVQGLTNHFLEKEGLNTSPEETWESIGGVRGLLTIYHNAGVMLEMADYAARNSDLVDPELLAALRNDALQIRVKVVIAWVRHTLNTSSETVRFNAFQVASMYTGMAARMMRLLRENAAPLVADFAGAM